MIWDLIFGMGPFGILFLGLAVIALAAVKTVPQGHNYTVSRFGKYQKTLFPGINVIFPVIDSIDKKVIVMEQVLNVPEQDVITADNASVRIDGVCFYQILDVYKSQYGVENLELAIRTSVLTCLRGLVGGMDLDEVSSQREQINANLQDKMSTAAENWGVSILKVELKDVSPSPDLLEAMASQLKAEREKRSNILISEGLAESLEKEAEGKKRALILDAEAKKEAAEKLADGELYACEKRAAGRLLEADAEQKAISVVAKAIKEDGEKSTEYFLGQEAIKQYGALAASENAKLIIVPTDAGQAIGAMSSVVGAFKSSSV